MAQGIMAESTTEQAIFLGIDTGGTFTDAVLFDPDRSPPALLAPGARVRLTVRSSPAGPA